MIRYALVCSAEHEFDAWFRSSADFDDQSARGLVTCVICGDKTVQRGLMAPNILMGRAQVPAEAETSGEPPVTAPPVAVPEPVAMAVSPDPQQRAMLEALVELKRKIVASSDNVGDRFAEEARKMHYGEAPERGIYGETTGDEVRALIDEGIEVHALPILPDEWN